MTKRSILVSGLCVAALVAGFGYFMAGSEAPAPTGTHGASDSSAAAPVSRPAITVAQVHKSVLNDKVRASGLISAVDRVQLQPQVEGQAIDWIGAEVGDHVAKGAVLARLSETALLLQESQLEASLASARAQIAQAEAQVIEAKSANDESRRQSERTEQLRAKGNTSQAAADLARSLATSATARVMVATQGLESARAQLGLVQAQLDDIELKLARTQITAPVAGKVVERNAEVGAIASAVGKPMFVLIRDGLLELSADVAEQDVPRLSVGMRATLRASGTDKTLTGTIRLIEPSIDTVTRLGRARISVDQSDLIRTGMFLEAEILISTREVVAAPITSVGTDAQGTFVMKVDTDGRVSRAPVKTGVRDGGRVEILAGLGEGEQVVVKAASFVRDGDLVNPVLANDATAAADSPATTN